MDKVMLRIVTDSASDITVEQAKEMGVDLVPLTITFEDGICPQETEEDFRIFFERLEKASRLPVTSQPSPQLFLEIFNDAKQKQEDVVVITLSGGLSGTVHSAEMAQKMSGYEKIHVIDSRQAIITQRMLVEYAVRLRAQGKNASEIEEAIVDVRDRTRICGAINTLTYLKMGGRIPASLAFFGNALNIKPVIVLEDTILKQLAKTRGMQAGKRRLWAEMEAVELDPAFPVYCGYTVNRQLGEAFMKETKEKYGLEQCSLFPVGGVIGTHVGPGCIALAFVAKKPCW